MTKNQKSFLLRYERVVRFFSLFLYAKGEYAMKLFATTDIKNIDKLTVEYEPISSIDLMRRAATRVADELLKVLGTNAEVDVFAGNGNNGGDAFFVAYLLKMVGVEVRLWYCCGNDAKLSADCAKAKEVLLSKFPQVYHEVISRESLPMIKSSSIVVDGLFGSGLNRPLSGFYADVVENINKAKCQVYAIDIPSGLMGEDNSANNLEHIVRATVTYTFQFPKIAFLLPENEQFVGAWQVLDIALHPRAMAEIESHYFLTSENDVKEKILPRAKFSHKGTFGHALIVGGSRGKMGAVVLASRACLRSGVGLLTAFVPRCGYEIMQISVPEAMTTDDVSENYLSQIPDIEKYDAVGVGIGLGQEQETVSMLTSLLKKMKKPLVLDADALNIIAQNRELLPLIPKNSIITPHPKEFDRLTSPSSNGYQRLQKAIDFARKYELCVVLKGAYTAVIFPDGECHFNTTGNPGMATAGSGDVLCGVITSLLAQKYSPQDAALIGVYYHGKAGDESARKRSLQNMTAGDIVDELFR